MKVWDKLIFWFWDEQYTLTLTDSYIDTESMANDILFDLAKVKNKYVIASIFYWHTVDYWDRPTNDDWDLKSMLRLLYYLYYKIKLMNIDTEVTLKVKWKTIEEAGVLSDSDMKKAEDLVTKYIEIEPCPIDDWDKLAEVDEFSEASVEKIEGVLEKAMSIINDKSKDTEERGWEWQSEAEGKDGWGKDPRKVYYIIHESRPLPPIVAYNLSMAIKYVWLDLTTIRQVIIEDYTNPNWPDATITDPHKWLEIPFNY